MSGVFPNHSPYYGLFVFFLRQCPRLNLESIHLARLAGQQSRDLLVSTPTLCHVTGAISPGLHVAAGDLDTSLHAYIPSISPATTLIMSPFKDKEAEDLTGQLLSRPIH